MSLELSSGPKPKAFTHAKHVPKAWLDADNPERQRDCRGCHNYSAEGGHDPQSVCTKCHFSTTRNEYTFALSASESSFLTGLEALRSPGSLFQHSNHLVLECRECHAVDGESINAPILMPKGGGIGLCLQCHVGEKPRQSQLRFMATWRDGTPVPEDHRGKALVKLRRGMVASLNGSREMGPNQGNEIYVDDFRHKDHILVDSFDASVPLTMLKGSGAHKDGGRQGNCGTCHAPMFDTAAGFGAPPEGGTHVPFDQAETNCGACHLSESNRAPIRFSVADSVRPSQTAGTFSHAQHLGFVRPAGATDKASAFGYDAIESKGCRACHDHDPSEASDFVLSGALGSGSAFHGCQDCHGESPWAPADHGDWWTHEDHGNWQTCASCHAFGSPNFKTERPQVAVERRRPGLFRVETQAHPHITVADGEDISASCAKCHRQPVKELPSRIQEAAFDHSSHLPSDPEAADCVGCHGATITGADSSLDIGTRALSTGGALQPVAEAQLGLTYDPAACAQCHLGAEPIPQPRKRTDGGAAEDAQPRSVVEFSHGAHMGKTLMGGRSIGCTDCHGMPGEGGQIGTLDAAQSCTLCHDHTGSNAPDRAPLTGGGVTPQEIAACASCHGDGVPAIGGVTQITTSRIVDIADGRSQFHPNDQDCDTCHVPRDGIIVATVASTHSRVFAERTFYSPEESTGQKPAIHRREERKLRDDRVACVACHWTNTLADAADGGAPPPNPETTRSRRKLGDLLLGFPGGLPEHFRQEK